MDTIRLKANLVPKTQIENNEEIQPNLGGPIENNLDEDILSIDNRWGFVYAKELKGYVTIGQKSGETLDSHATAEGYQVIASGPYSHAEGKDTIASKNCCHAEGNNTQATEECSHAEGSDTQAEGKYSHAEGNGSVVDANAFGAHAEGHETLAHGKYSHAEGEKAYAYGDYSHAEGYGNLLAGVALGESSHTEGHLTLAGDVIPSESNSSQHAEGYRTEARGTYGAHSEGRQTKAQGTSSHAEGYLTIAYGNYSHAEGYNNKAEGVASHVEGGELNFATGNYSHSEGLNTKAIGNCSHAEGYITEANENYSHTEGNYTIANEQGAHAEGNGYYGYCPGVKINSLGVYNDTIDNTTYYYYELETIYGLIEKGDYIYPFKYTLEERTKEYEDAIQKLQDKYSQMQDWYNSHPNEKEYFNWDNWESNWQQEMNELVTNKQIAIDEFLAGAEFNPTEFPTFKVEKVGTNAVERNTFIYFYPGNGYIPDPNNEKLSFYIYKKTEALGNGSHAEGDGTKASGWASHSEGLFTKASGANAHAEGYGCFATGIGSHAEGVKTQAFGAGSHAQGTFTIASNRYASVLGCCNLLDPENSSTENRGKYLEIVGNGDFNSKNGEIYYRSNARTLDWNGNQWNAGDMVIGPRDPKKENNIGIGSNRLKLEFSTDGVGTGNNAPKNKIGSWQLWAINKENNGTKNGLYIGYQSTGASSSTYDCWIDSTNRSFHTKGTYQTQTGNDYAECRQSVSGQEIKPGQVVCENGDGTLSLNIKRLQKGCEIVSDTYGFMIQPYEEYNLPIATSGRVLAYPDKDPSTFEIGAPVCAGENGTVSQMTEEEERLYPSRILGTVSEIPTYETWGSENPVKVDGRIWIRVR